MGRTRSHSSSDSQQSLHANARHDESPRFVPERYEATTAGAYLERHEGA